MKKMILKMMMTATMLSLLMLNVSGCGKKENNKTTQETVTPTETIAPTDTPKPTAEPTAEPTPEPTPVDNSVITKDNLPVIDGATANLPLYQGVVGKLLNLSEEEALKYVLCSTTSGAYNNLVDGLADMIFVTYPSEEQVQAAAEKGVEFEYHQILTGAFVFFVNKDNPVDSLTVEQLKGIYKGEITNWKEVGGNDEPITAYQREEGSGSQSGLYRYVVSKDEVMKAPKEYYFNTMDQIVDAFSDSNKEYDNGLNAIGYSYYYYVVNMKKNDQIKLLKIEGIEPNDETIGNGTFPFCNPNLVVVRKGTEATSPVYTIIDWILSDEGAELASSLGYVVNRNAK